MIEVFAIVFGGWIVSLCLHEFSHAAVAYLGGDKSVKEKGYLTFNPLKYTHPAMTFLYPLLFLALGGIGLPGGAVYINRRNLRGPGWESAVSLAGPLSNGLLAAALSIPFLAGLAEGSEHWAWGALAFLIQLQVCALLLNLLPVPPLDGSGVLSPWLPRDARSAYESVSGFGFFVVFAALWFIPEANHAFWDVINRIVETMGVPAEAAYRGFTDFRFWNAPR